MEAITSAARGSFDCLSLRSGSDTTLSTRMMMPAWSMPGVPTGM